jgi:hypothetical protein
VEALVLDAREILAIGSVPRAFVRQEHEVRAAPA